MLHLTTVHDHHRLSTQDLLLRIEEAVERGETEFVIEASGQHDIGGPLWNREGRPLRFTVTNPGQRVGGMCLPDTEVIVNGPAPADVGWLNAGGRIVRHRRALRGGGTHLHRRPGRNAIRLAHEARPPIRGSGTLDFAERGQLLL